VPTEALTESPPAIPSTHPNEAVKVPPRLVSDQLINIFFQEWAPLYPVVHRPTVLKAYEQYLSNLDSFKSNTHDMTQLNLIFGIAGLASKVCFNGSRRRNWLTRIAVENQPGPDLLRRELVFSPRVAVNQYLRAYLTMPCSCADILHDQGRLPDSAALPKSGR
jgi:hypothetical protein